MTIKEYWNLIGQEQFLAITWESDFSRACSFCRMLMNHKNFHFTQIPDKTNDMIFLKSPKTLFWGHFWPFLPNGDFFQKVRLSQTIYGPLTPSKFHKKLMSQSRENLQTDGRTDERTDGQNDRQTDRPYFIGPFQPKPRVQKQRKVKKT